MSRTTSRPRVTSFSAHGAETKERHGREEQTQEAARRTGYERPHTEAFRGVLDALGGTEDIWMIGDNAEADVAGAKAAGISAILVRKQREGVEPYCEGLGSVAEILDG